MDQLARTEQLLGAENMVALKKIGILQEKNQSVNNDHFIDRFQKPGQQVRPFIGLLRVPFRFFVIKSLFLLCACWLWCFWPTSGLCTDLFSGSVDIKGLDLFSRLPADQIFNHVQTILEQTEKGNYYPEAKVIHPDQDAVLPKDMASPHIVWKDTFLRSSSWLVSLTLSNGSGFHRLTTRSVWVPEADVWSQVQKVSGGQPIIIEITGVDRQDGFSAVTYTRRRIHISEDGFDARIVFKNAPLPFLKSKQNPELSQWLVGDVTDYGPPKVVLEGLNSCAHCHRFSANGKSFGIDIDRGGDKGGYLVADVKSEMALSESDYFTWNGFSGLGTESMGLFSTLSPTGRWIATTVDEISLFAMFNQVMFSQLFFPIAGKIAVYDRQQKTAFYLPGADLDDIVQTCPEFSPDEKKLVFARTPKENDLLEVMNGKKFLKPLPGETIEDLNAKYRIRYDLYVQPFNRGRGGKAHPLKGASQNGKSNYFPRYSPDGKWIVFCQSDTGLVLQPDSSLYAVPAMGGTAKRLSCNSGRMNSWHSFTPNGHWLVFASKAVTPFTEVLISHFNADGTTSPPVALMRFNREGFAAIIPETLSSSGSLIQKIGIRFSTETNAAKAKP